MDFTDKVLGLGLPLCKPYKDGPYPGVSSNLDKICDSIFNILSTRKGERIFLPDFGSNLYYFVFRSNNAAFRDAIYNEIFDALQKWEKRITVTNIFIPKTVDNGIVNIRIDFIVKQVQLQATYIFPYMTQPYNLGG